MRKQQEIKPNQRYWLLLQCEFWIYHILVACFCFYVLSQFARIDQEIQGIYQTDQYKYSQEAIEMWQKGYIIDIKVVSTDNCPEGYDSLIDYSWPGIIDGCYCEALINSHNTQYVLQGACSSELISYGCTTINSIDALSLKMWKGGKLLCYKRAESLSFYNSTLEKLEDGTAMKKCSSEKDYQVSMLPQIDCPITMISNSSVGSTQTTLSLDDESNLNFVSEVGYPIADFKLTEYQFCPFFDQINISPGKNGNYILEVINQTETCQKTDPRIVQFDYMTEEGFITNNTRVYDLLSQLPGYPRPSISYFYRLGYIAYPDWTYGCRTSRSHDLLSATKHLTLTHVSQKTSLLLYVGVPCLLIVSIFIRILYMLRQIFQLRSKKQFNMVINTDEEVAEQIPNLNIVKTLKRELCYFIIEVVLIVATFVVLIICAMTLISESVWIKDMFLKGCSQEHLNGIFRHYEDKVDLSAYIAGRTVVFMIIILTLVSTHFALRVKYGDLKGIQEPVQEELSNEQLLKDDMEEKNMNVMDSHLQLQDSSDIIMQREKEDFKMYDLDNAMGMQLNGADETNINFYAQQSIENDGVQIGKKKKKKKGIKRKNLFKDE